MQLYCLNLIYDAHNYISDIIPTLSLIPHLLNTCFIENKLTHVNQLYNIASSSFILHTYSKQPSASFTF